MNIKGFIKKHRFKMIITLLLLIFFITCFYMLWVHVPYQRQQNKLEEIKTSLIEAYDIEYGGYFNEYNGDETYYIISLLSDKDEHYALFDEDLNYVKTFVDDVYDEDKVKDNFIQKYNKEPTRIEIGYENDLFVYCVTYLGDDQLIYAYYTLNDGLFIKAIPLKGGE